MKPIFMAALWLLWLLNILQDEQTEAAIYITGFIVLMFLPERGQ